MGEPANQSIDTELIRRLNREWEFFEDIHKFMIRKTTNLHSYALSQKCSDTENNNNNTKKDKEEILTPQRRQQQLQITSDLGIKDNEKLVKDKIDILARFTAMYTRHCINPKGDYSNNDFKKKRDGNTSIVTNGKLNEMREKINPQDGNRERKAAKVRNTDHDFYSKRRSLSLDSMEHQPEKRSHHSPELEEQYFADNTSDESQQEFMMVDLEDFQKTSLPCTERDDVEMKSKQNQQERSQKQSYCERFATSSPETSGNISSSSISVKKSSERDKYYRHKRRFNRRIEKKFDAILHVMSQIVKAEYPSIDVSPLVGLKEARNMEKRMARFSSNSDETINSL